MVDPVESFCPPQRPSMYDRGRLAAVAMVPDAWFNIPTWPSIGGERRVVVIGGGISGLCVAWGLRNAGFRPIVLEWTDRVGGRIHTLRDHFATQYVELGATRIPDNHPLPLAYIRHFDLPLIEYPQAACAPVYSVLGQRFGNTPGRTIGYPNAWGLTLDEARFDIHELCDYYTARALDCLSHPRSADWPTASDQLVFQGLSFLESLAALGASNAAKEICLAQAGTIIGIFDALSWLAAPRIDGQTKTAYAIAGGNDRLTTCFAESLAESIVTGARVQAVHSTSDGILVEYTHRGRHESIQGDYVVCCIPHRNLLDLHFSPPLSTAKRTAINAIPMGQVTRVNLQFSRRFWNLDEGLQGLHIASTNGLVERLWDLTSVQPGASGILVAYAEHEHAVALDQLPSEEARLQRVLDEIESIFPGARNTYVKGYSHSWQKPWCKGAWAAFLPGQMNYLADLQRAEGRVFFAGDQTTFHSAWMQGALESAHFAVAEVLAARRHEMSIA